MWCLMWGKDVESWARRNFASAQLGDVRRTRRLVQVAAAIARDPEESLPEQLVEWSDLKAAYRLFDGEGVTFDAVAGPHWGLRQECGAGRCLLVSDTASLNFTPQRKIPGLGPLGKGQGYGFLLHSSLMLRAETGEVLGLAGQKLWCRPGKSSKRRTRTQALREPRESQLWTLVIDQIGPPPKGSQWVHVADRGADNFEVYHACQQQRCDWIIRGRCLKRTVEDAAGTEVSLVDLLPPLQALTTLTLEVASRKKTIREAGRVAHTAQLEIAAGALRVPPPRLRSPALRAQKIEAIAMNVVHVRELKPPANSDPVEWVLLTSLPVSTATEVLDIVTAYQRRWTIEEWHKALKSGCQVTARQLRTRERLEPLIALLSIEAVRLLSLKMQARQSPDQPAEQTLPPSTLKHLQRLRPHQQITTAREAYHAIARLGGFLARKHDGDPGWQTLWRGWRVLDQHLRAHSPEEPP